MRLNLTNQGSPEDDSEIILHGSRPKRPEKYCGNCAKRYNCSMLSSAMANLSVLMPMPMSKQQFARANSGELIEIQAPEFFPLPMPCGSDQWVLTGSGEMEKNPLIQRLGLTNVAEPINYERMRAGNSNDTK